MDLKFRESFEKEAGLKHLALAGSLALSPMAKASDDAVRQGVRAFNKTEMGQQVAAKMKGYQKKVNNLIRPDAAIPEGPIVKAKNSANIGAASPSTPTPKISLRDLGTVNVKYDNFAASASPNRINARYNVNNNTFVEAFKRGKNSGIQVGYNKSF